MIGKLSKVSLNDYKPIREVIFTSLREAIVSGELKPGERLLEVTLANKMGVSRTPVREAIRKLELEGFVLMLPRKGAQVADLTAKDIMNVLEIRAALDGLATSLAAQRMSDEEIDDLKRIHEQFIQNAAKDNLQGALKKDVEFHELIYSASRNEKLAQLADNLSEQIQRFRVVYMKDTGSTAIVINEHMDILEAITKRKPEEARLAALKHIRRQEEKIMTEIKKNS